MKRILCLFIMLILVVAANAQDSTSHNLRLRVGIDDGVMQVGYIDNGTLRHTDYAVFMLRPELRFSKHWGVALSGGYASSFHNNLNDGTYNPLAQYRAICGSLAPYYELQNGRWWFQMGIGVSMRVRFFYYAGEPCNFGKTGAFGAILQPRIGCRISDNLSLSAALTCDRTFLDILEHYTLHPEFTRKNGAVALTIGACWEF